jgi:hypothetical protein
MHLELSSTQDFPTDGILLVSEGLCSERIATLEARNFQMDTASAKVGLTDSAIFYILNPF